MPLFNANFFSSEEEKFLIHLKEDVKPELTWQEIHNTYKKEFPSSPRSRGGLQVHYSRKLQPAKRTAREAVVSKFSVTAFDVSGPTTLSASSSTTSGLLTPPASNFSSGVKFSTPSVSTSACTVSPLTPTPSRKSVRIDTRVALQRTKKTTTKAAFNHDLFGDSDSSLSSLGASVTPDLSPIINEQIDMEKLVVAMKIQTQKSSSSRNQKNTAPKSNDALPVAYSDHLSPNDSTGESSNSASTGSRHSQPGNATRTSLLDDYPVIMEGWIPADMKELKRIETAPRFFTHPPADRIVEFNTRSQSYRIRRRMDWEPASILPTTESDKMEEQMVD